MDSTKVSYGGNAESAADFIIFDGAEYTINKSATYLVARTATDITKTAQYKVSIEKDFVWDTGYDPGLFFDYIVYQGLLSTFKDSFDDNSISSKWVYCDPEVSEASGKIQFNIPDGAGAKSIQTDEYQIWDLDYAHIEIVEHDVDANHGIKLGIFIQDGLINGYVDFGVYGNNIIAYADYDGDTVINDSTTYVPTSHRWLRIRYNGGTLYFEAASERQYLDNNWQVITSTSYQSNKVIKIELEGRNNGSGIEYVGKIDNFNLIPTATTAQKSTQYTVLQTFSTTKSAQYVVASGIDIQKFVVYTIPKDYTVTKNAVYAVATTSSDKTKSSQYAVARPIDITKSASYLVAKTYDITKTSDYDVARTIGITKNATYAVALASSDYTITKNTVYAVARSTDIQKSASYVVISSEDITKTSQYTVPKTYDVTKSAQYSVATVKDKTTSSQYYVATTANTSKTAGYVVLSIATKQLTSTYVVISSEDISKTAQYQVPHTSTITKSSQYTVPKSYDITKSSAYVVSFSTTATKNAQYIVTFSTTVQKTASYVVISGQDITKQATYTTFSSVTVQKPITYTTWTVQTITKGAAYVIQRNTDLQRTAQYTIATTQTVQKSAQFFVATIHDITKQASYVAVSTATITKQAIYTVPSTSTKQLTTGYVVISAQDINKTASYTVPKDYTINRTTDYDVATSSDITKQTQYVVSNYTDKNIATSYSIANNYGIQKSIQYVVISSEDISKTGQYTVPSQSTVTKNATYAVASSTDITKQSQYTVPSVQTKQLTTSYVVNTGTEVFLSATYKVLNTVSLTEQAQYYVARSSDITKQAQYFVAREYGNQLVQNSDFEIYENEVGRWTNWFEWALGTTILTQETNPDYVISGSGSVKISVDSSNSLAYVYQADDSLITVRPNTSYRMSVVARSEPSGQIELAVAYGNDTKYLQSNGTWGATVYRFQFNTTASIQSYTIDFVTGSDQNTVRIRDLKRSGGGSQANKTFWIDNAQIFDSPSMPAIYSVANSNTITKGSSYIVQSTGTAQKQAQYVVISSEDISKVAQYTVPTTGNIQKTNDYDVAVIRDYTSGGTEVLCDGYGSSNYFTSSSLYSGGYTRASQSFTGNGGQLSMARFYLSKTGSPTGNINVYLYSHSGTYGTSSVPLSLLATSTTTYQASSLTTSMQWIQFNFNPYTLVNGTRYTIVVEYSGGNSSNMVNVGNDSQNPVTHSGNMALFIGTWLTFSTIDAIFEVYTGTPLVTGIPSTYLVVANKTIAKNSTYDVVKQLSTVAEYRVAKITDYVVGGVVDSYADTSDFEFYISSNEYHRVGQSFTGDGGVLSTATFKVYRYNNPTGNMYYHIYEHDGTFGATGVPIGSPIATSDPIDVSTIQTVGTLVTGSFSGANRITLVDGHNYFAVIEYTGGNASNDVTAQSSSTGTHGGNVATWNWNSSSWTYALADLMFSVTSSSSMLSAYVVVAQTDITKQAQYVVTYDTSGDIVFNSGYYVAINQDISVSNEYVVKRNTDIGIQSKYTIVIDRSIILSSSYVVSEFRLSSKHLIVSGVMQAKPVKVLQNGVWVEKRIYVRR